MTQDNSPDESLQKSLHRDPAAAELVALVAEFLENKILPAAAADSHSYDEVAAAVEALRIAGRELQVGAAADAATRDALARLGFSEEAQLTAAIRNGDLDDRAGDVTSCLRALARQRLAVTHPGYQNE